MTSAGQLSDDFEDLFENGAIAIHLVGRDGTILRANRAELDMLGYSADEYIGRNIREFHADEATIGDILDRLTCGEKLNWYPARLLAKDGSIKDVEITSSVRFDGDGFLNTRCFTRDVTALRIAQAQVQEKQRYLEQILDALPAAVYTTDAKGKVTYFNQEAANLAGRVPEVGADEWCVTWRLRNEDGTLLAHEDCPMAVALKENRPVRGAVAFAERPDGKLVPFTPYPTPLHNERGELVGGINMLVDITEQKAREDHIRFVMHELSHRSKNLLSVVIAVANTTLTHAQSLDEFRTKFANRLYAMARSHELLVSNSWSGADIRDVINTEIVTFVGNDQVSRARLNGEPILLNPSTAQTLSLAVHELATNATKYGAFSKESGSVEIGWQKLGEDSIEFSWHEAAAVAERTPARTGFGTQILSSLFKQPRFQFNASGLRFSGVLSHHPAVAAASH